jgi:hypothetical protein
MQLKASSRNYEKNTLMPDIIAMLGTLEQMESTIAPTMMESLITAPVILF